MAHDNPRRHRPFVLQIPLAKDPTHTRDSSHSYFNINIKFIFI